MAERPGIMLYFDLLPTVEELTDDEAGQLLRAMLNYGANGALPEFADRTMKVIWKGIQPRLDHDAQRYQKVVLPRRKYATYCREEKKAGRTPKKFDEWYDDGSTEQSDDAECSDHLISLDIKSIQLQPQLQPQLKHQNNCRDNYNGNDSNNNSTCSEDLLSTQEINKTGDCKGEWANQSESRSYKPMTEEEESATRQRYIEQLEARKQRGGA